MEQKDKRRKSEWILWISVVAVGVLLFFLTQINSADGGQVVIRVSGKVEKVCSLYEDNVITINGKDGGSNRLVIKKGEVWVQEASCPDKLCVRQAGISKTGQSIICLPNEVVVEVQEEEKGDDVDVIAK